MKRHDYEYVRQVFNERGCELLETQYVSSHTPMLYRCKCDRVAKITFGNFQGGQHCIDCGGRKRLNYKNVKQSFIAQGCELLEENYINAHTDMRYKCRCGNVSVTTWNNFSKGKLCWECRKEKLAGHFRHNYEYVKQYFLSEGCELLDNEYFNLKTEMQYRCSCGTLAKSNFIDFKKGKRCHKCWKIRCSGHNHHNWNPDRDSVRLNKIMHNRCGNALYNTLLAIGQVKTKKKQDLLGYSVAELKDHLTSHPNWPAVKDKRWEIDHIFPICAFVQYGITDIKLINCLENLQPMLKSSNISKGGKYNKAAFEIWLKSKGIMI